MKNYCLRLCLTILILQVGAFIKPQPAKGQYLSHSIDAPFAMEPIQEYIFPDRWFSIKKYGAKVNDKQSCTKAFAKAIEACHKAGGGHVRVPKGEWLTGAIHLKSNVDLYLDEGAVLRFSDDSQDYLPAVLTSWEGLECYNYSPLIYALECENIAISGNGTIQPMIDGWTSWFGRPQEHLEASKQLYTWASTDVPVEQRQMAVGLNHMRPHLIQFNRCKNVLLQDFHISGSPFWTIHMLMCDGGIARRLNVYAHNHNNDGIDLEMSSNFLIEDCKFDQGDDAIVLKAGRNRDAWRLNKPTENIVVRNCHVVRGHCLLGIGSEMSGGVRNVLMENCAASDTVFRMMYLKTNHRRGGFIDHIYMKHCQGTSAGRMFEIDTDVLYQWKDLVPTYETRLTRINDIYMEDCQVDRCDAICEINGDPCMPIGTIGLKNLKAGSVNKFLTRNSNAPDVKIENLSYSWANNNNDFVVRAGETMHVVCDTAKVEPVVKSAIEMLATDCYGVLRSPLSIGTEHNGNCITLSVSPDIKREGFRLSVKDGRLNIEASDGHGMAYGLLEVSRLMGVSPWTWWSDMGYTLRDELHLHDGFIQQEAPDVDFRGIFINDEDWGLMPWSSMTYEPTGKKGSIGPKTYSRVFELLLRLRANTIWPAMHECSEPFFLTPGNREAAAKYGIYMGGSHCEPMACSAAVEWGRRGVGDYDYVNNSAEVRRFWEERLKEVSGQEILFTIGMRGVHDGAMQGAKTLKEQLSVLKRVLADQRKMLAQYINPDVTKVPQVFVPYKEVLDIYNAGLKVPEDVCLMWCDDNYGYIRHYPTAEEQSRKGGNGIYYHVSYWGRPHDYLWLGSMSPYLMYQQLHKGYEKGIGRIWILNVGDIKPSEYQIELFMDMAWDMKRVSQQGVYGHMKAFYSREFGPQAGGEMAAIMNDWHRLGFKRKPEHMAGTRVEEADYKYWNTIRDLPWSREETEQRLAQYKDLSDKAEALLSQIPERLHDAYFQLIKYPVQGAHQLNRKLLIAQGARHGEADWADSDAALDSIKALTLIYNQGYHNNGKWNRMMDCQPRKLPVFDYVKHINSNEAWTEIPATIKLWNGVDASDGSFVCCEGLGYAQGAAELIPNEALTYGNVPDSSTISLHLLPSHAVDGKHLGLWIQVGDGKPQWVDFRTEGRSEEWKVNVLRNQAIRDIKVASGGTVKIWSEYDGVVIDQIVVR